MPKRGTAMFVRTPVRIALAYALTGVVWILCSDRVVSWFGGELETLTRLQTYKGWGFVAVTALALYGLLRRYEAETERAAQSLRDSEGRLKRAAGNQGLHYPVSSRRVTEEGELIQNPAASRTGAPWQAREERL
jgi:hypothetical protein